MSGSRPHSPERTKMAGTKPRTTSYDREVGARARVARVTAGMSMEQLGDVIGCTHQSVEKHEKGQSRMSAKRLRDVAGALDVSVGYLLGYPCSWPLVAPELEMALDLAPRPAWFRYAETDLRASA